ncbi:MAG: hypothetical protein LBK47_02625 [Prevotellaceae bacterium]|jgi:GTP cyclohydrolase II|nr:hypothetical protein [Prevotellaceae bacterium]
MKTFFKNEKISIVNLLLAQVSGRDCICIAFEPVGYNMGNYMHIALIFNRQINLENEESLWKTLKKLDFSKPIPLRIHSECLLGDALFSEDCDCRAQLRQSIKLFSESNYGILLYLRQEGRGIGLREKFKCLALQKGYIQGEKVCSHYSADEANHFYGHKKDERNYGIASDFLRALNINEVAILTGNPDKIKSLKDKKITVNKLLFSTLPEIGKLSYKAQMELDEKIKRGYHYKG